MGFWNAEDFAERASAASLFWGVVEHDNLEGQDMPIAAFMYEADAQGYCDYLATVGRTARAVDLMEVRGL